MMNRFDDLLDQIRYHRERAFRLNAELTKSTNFASWRDSSTTYSDFCTRYHHMLVGSSFELVVRIAYEAGVHSCSSYIEKEK